MALVEVIPVSLTLFQTFADVFGAVAIYREKYKFDLNLYNFTVKDLQKKAILIVGESGSGKTSFIRAFLKYIRDSSFKYGANEMIGKDDSNERGIEGASSTIRPKVYKCVIDSVADENFLLIDTPGIKDTSGCVQDDSNLDDISSTLAQYKDQGYTVSNVVFMYNGEHTRFSDLKDYIYESFKIFFPSSTNIFFLASHITQPECVNPFGKISFFLNNPYECYLKKMELKQAWDETKDSIKYNIAYSQAEENNYNAQMQEYDLKISSGERAFRKILVLLFQSSCSIPIADIITNYQLYSNIREKIQSLQQLFIASDCNLALFEHFESNEASVQQPLDQINEYLQKYQHLIVDPKSYQESKYPFREFVCACPTCFRSYNISLFTTEAIHNINILQHSEILPSCECSRRPPIIFRNAKVTSVLLGTLSRISKSILTEAHVSNEIQSLLRSNLVTVQKILDDKVLTDLHSLIDTLQRTTLMKDFEKCLNGKIDYLTNLERKHARNTTLLAIINMEKDQYQKVINILYREGWNDLATRLKSKLHTASNNPSNNPVGAGANISPRQVSRALPLPAGIVVEGLKISCNPIKIDKNKKAEVMRVFLEYSEGCKMENVGKNPKGDIISLQMESQQVSKEMIDELMKLF
jgi:GTPase SAR1 family protein